MTTPPPNQAGFDRRYDVQGLDAIDVAVLDTFPYVREDDAAPYVGSPMDIEIVTDEFSPVCPWSGLPDFGRLEIRYQPREKCVELKSLKYYLTSYRFVGIYHEHATRRLLSDLVGLLDPLRLEIRCDYGMRGGLNTVCTVRYVAEDQQAGQP
ncbi:preQ(1) synthase [Deinococcus wulumuqiensis]|uniref:NADPH-dependent 7-cyano-7-deazaguanine reductase n=1 Tax=Deinococcus wulumuqiensis TaxID=980427 RepID=A0AAV4K4Q0_9DEIO|nr:preQ(1) synthase [Deinococcus wulumuqiensis]QII21155.1 NADPH-dependent 7-cyano-7-deazaguanine reductase QueF [Deinococcus wulumuqiensis R12]GGI83614.1 NADPH-dependent 7-cyano-7-deazaguanine reductase [Deinococcus wulumuqiensis]GGP29622.1 NADPH-dependent 7-cyano-7-deazaguanine reductase [Deinococcus wulumuqiensis]